MIPGEPLIHVPHVRPAVRLPQPVPMRERRQEDWAKQNARVILIWLAVVTTMFALAFWNRATENNDNDRGTTTTTVL